ERVQADALAVEHAEHVVVRHQQQLGGVGEGLVAGPPGRIGVAMRADDRQPGHLRVQATGDRALRGIGREQAVFVQAERLRGGHDFGYWLLCDALDAREEGVIRHPPPLAGEGWGGASGVTPSAPPALHWSRRPTLAWRGHDLHALEHQARIDQPQLERVRASSRGVPRAGHVYAVDHRALPGLEIAVAGRRVQAHGYDL